MEGTCFAETPESGPAEVIENPEVKSAFLEASNVEVTVEMTRLIEAQKAFSFNSKMIQTADEVEQIINTLR
jgi:flagellar basal body rod protein FlgG